MSHDKKSVLIIAYACEPNEPSEPGVGWNFSQEISKFMKVTVLTRENNRQIIESIDADNINYIYYDLPKFFVVLKKRIPFGLQIYYTLWQWGAYLNANKLIKKQIEYAFQHVFILQLSSLSMAAVDLPSFCCGESPEECL